MRKYIADLHVHTLLSPCAEIEMTPRLITKYAAMLGIDILAITDHNTSRNVKAAIEAAKEYDITIIPGMELQTQEEIHLICLFPTLEALEEWQQVVNESLPDMKNNDKVLGAQFVVDAQDELVAVEERLLLASTKLSVEEAVSGIDKLGGICIAAHIDRQAYSVISQLGFIPPGVSFAALEISRHASKQMICEKIPSVQAFPVVVSSDAHRLGDLVSPKTLFYLEEPTFIEIVQAFKGENQRRVVVEPPR